MRFDKATWKELDINTDSLWIMGPRAKGGKHTNCYHGNFAPQIPNQMIRRYTEEGDCVLEMFMGSGTTLYECESLNRDYIGFDINTEIIDFVRQQMKDTTKINYFINECDICDTTKVCNCITENLTFLKKKRIDHIICHPPYLDVIKFTEKREDLSQVSDVKLFIDSFIKAIGNVFPYLRSKKYLSLVVGDVYRDGEIIPLGFYLMYAIKRHFKCQLKGIVVKDMVGNRAKIGQENLWRYKALKSDFFLFKHEYLFVFKKV